MKATFQHSVDVLVKAYFEGTLAHRVCTACAVGNLVADALGKQMLRSDVTAFDNTYYADGYRVNWPVFSEMFQVRGDMARARREIEATGYTIDQIATIEIAFETCDKPESINNWKGRRDKSYYVNDEWMFNGLMAVVDVLAEIHGIDLSTKESAKLLFVKQ